MHSGGARATAVAQHCVRGLVMIRVLRSLLLQLIGCCCAHPRGGAQRSACSNTVILLGRDNA
jgi:hypothetical protein